MNFPLIANIVVFVVLLFADAPRDKRTYFREINYIAAAFQYQKKNYNSA
ncbi:glucosamine-6-phosphate deaminase [Escherichia coli]|nr:glucosamine-6-phosphate deaminase [Escherichia coli]